MSDDKTVIEKDWITTSGLRAVVLFVRNSHRCGYVGVGGESSLYEKDYNSLYEDGVSIDVHGGLTFSDKSEKYPADNNGLWWFGFDCAHSGDATKYFSGPDDVFRSLEYCVAECENMATQLKAAEEKYKELKRMTDSDSYKAAFEYLYDSESTKDLPIQPKVVARVAKLIEQRDELMEDSEKMIVSLLRICYGDLSARTYTIANIALTQSNSEAIKEFIKKHKDGVIQSLTSVEGK